jgi:hypothetical protein
VHPDLFSGHEPERLQNTQALKDLSAAIDNIRNGVVDRSVDLTFFVRGGASGFLQIAVQVQESLQPLYRAFGLDVSPETSADPQEPGVDHAAGIDVVDWLKNTVQVCREPGAWRL